MQRQNIFVCITSIRMILSHSLSRCSCNDLYWIWISDDISSSLWLQQCCIQHAHGLICNPVVNDYFRCVPVCKPGHQQWEWLLHNRSWNGNVCMCLYVCVAMWIRPSCIAKRLQARPKLYRDLISRREQYWQHLTTVCALDHLKYALLEGYS